MPKKERVRSFDILPGGFKEGRRVNGCHKCENLWYPRNPSVLLSARCPDCKSTQVWVADVYKEPTGLKGLIYNYGSYVFLGVIVIGFLILLFYHSLS